jgi:hypothetical protein
MEDDRLFPSMWAQTALGILFFGGIFFLLFYLIHREETVIDTRVETLDGRIYNCTDSDSYDNGMTHIREPYEIIIPSKTIKVISKIK